MHSECHVYNYVSKLVNTQTQTTTARLNFNYELAEIQCIGTTTHQFKCWYSDLFLLKNELLNLCDRNFSHNFYFWGVCKLSLNGSMARKILIYQRVFVIQGLFWAVKWNRWYYTAWYSFWIMLSMGICSRKHENTIKQNEHSFHAIRSRREVACVFVSHQTSSRIFNLSIW